MPVWVLVFLIATGNPHLFKSRTIDTFDAEDICLAVGAEMDETATCIEVK